MENHSILLSNKAQFQNDYSFKLLENPFPNENIHSGPYMILKPMNMVVNPK